MSTNIQTINNQKKLVNILSIAIPLAVALLIGIRTKVDLGAWTKVLPVFVAIVNSVTAIVLLLALYFIKKNKIQAHRNSMYTAVGLGAIFLVLYILYHVSNESTSYGNDGIIKNVYYFFLISHITLSIGVVRLVLLALHYAINNQITDHKRIVKWAYPIWLYVSVSGVIVYFMIRPFYS
ncbi:MAG: DUF420 domain-containing protein [Bacteroidota bacterium]|nr:DUF420 domain-containing protein [Bacteroidota bacterium]